MTISWPHHLEAEKVLLGAIALEPALIKKVRTREADFYTESHRKIFGAMLELDREGVPPDLATLLPKIGTEDTTRLNEYTNLAVTTSNLKYFEDIVLEIARKRQLQRLYLKTIRELQEASFDESFSSLRVGTGEVMLASGGDKLVFSREIAGELWNFIERRYQEKGALSGITTGLKDLDRLTDGWMGGDLIILASRPGTGKSALAMHFAQTAAAAGNAVGIISLEMGGHQIGIRSLSSLSKVELWKLRKGMLSIRDFESLTPAIDNLAKLPLIFSFASRDTRSMSRTISQMVELHGCRLIVLDYLQLAKGEGANERREREVAEISWALKTAAQAHRVPVIALSQLSREVEKQNRKPVLADLRDSGAIEQDADVVLFLYRKERKGNGEKEAKGGPIEIEISKGRNIGTGIITVYFDPERMVFQDCNQGERGDPERQFQSP